MTEPTYRTGYRPEIDGLRTVAVLLVVVFHAELAWLPGGFIGVDVFFVLSGFLITGLLVDDMGRRQGSLTAFYARRARRLLPAATITIVATSVAWLLTASVIERSTLGADARSASLYYSNWHFAVQATDYFAAGNAPSPFLHFWSLSAEEQFYLVWPALVALAFAAARRWWPQRAARRGADLVMLMAVVGGIASFVSLALTTRAGNAPMAYFGTHNRAYQLLAGAVLALWARRRRRRRTTPRLDAAVQVVALVALVVLATSKVNLGSGSRGWWATMMALALLAALEHGTHHPVGRALASSPMVWLGKLSYGIYLWHWPVLLLLRKFLTTNAWWVLVVGLAISVVLAATSSRLAEMPIRTSERLAARSRAVVFGGLALSAVVGLVVAPLILASERRPVFVADRPPVTVPTADGGTVPEGDPFEGVPVPSLDEIEAQNVNGESVACLPTTVPGTCMVHQGTRDRTMLVVGDSHLMPFRTSLAAFGEQHDITVHVWIEFGCPWLEGVYVDGRWTDKCVPRQAQLYAATLPQLEPDVVVVMNDAYDDPSYPRTLAVGATLTPVPPAPTIIEAMPRSVERMMEHTERLVVVQPWPSLSFNPRDCLASATSIGDCTAVASTPLPSDPTMYEVAERTPGMSVVDLNQQICPRLPLCDAVVDGTIVRFDQDHLTADFALKVAPELERQLVALGVFD